MVDHTEDEEEIETVEPDARVCVDCLMAIANDDYSGLDYHYDEAKAEKRMEEIQTGIWSLSDEGKYHLAVGEDEGFSWSGCDCCGSGLGGERHGVYLIEIVK